MAFQSFTGSSRKPRQISLGGTRNPFASAGGPSAVHTAQQERERRQRERDRILAAKTLQRRWRGYSLRKGLRQQQRDKWDAEEQGGEGPYHSEDKALEELQRMLRFLKLEDDKDVKRLRRYMNRLQLSQRNGLACASGSWPKAYLRLQELVLTAIPRSRSTDWVFELETVSFLSHQTPQFAGLNARLLYHTLANLNQPVFKGSDNYLHVLPALVEVLKAPLRAVSAESFDIYEAFACEFLTRSFITESPWYPKWLSDLADHVNYKILASALSSTVLSNDYNGYEAMRAPQSRLNLLGCFIYFHRHAHHFRNAQAYSSHKDFVLVISTLLSSIAESKYLDALQNPNPDNETAVGTFAREQIMSLVNQESVSSLLVGASNSPPKLGGPPHMSSEAKQLASYALTLLRFFPREGDNIRMWLYRGSTDPSAAANPENKIPAIKYFWQAARKSMVFKTISRDPRSVIKLAKLQRSSDGEAVNTTQTEWVQNDWRLILIFLELYTFVLRLMDDEEFFSASSLASSASSSTGNSSWARHNALPPEDIQELTSFLKNVGFTMYFHAKEIMDPGEDDNQRVSLSTYFRVEERPFDEQQVDKVLPKTPDTSIAGLNGISIDYVKGLVTGLLRMVHERDSRRKFLPADHWLMTSSFDMGNFIPDVVAEEENRYRLQEVASDDPQMNDTEMEDETQLIGTARDRQIRYQERLEQQQRLSSRKRYMQAVAPRSEVLQNMPFFIPFTTRVQIFREFVRRDQIKRRLGHVDPESWRVQMMNSFNPADNMARHTATIRRKHEFEDAFEQFYELKDGLKEPIQITFMDQFGGQEAGIDGGGVTKEFLTSVTSQAFTPSKGLDLFAENEQHLLYPNPAAVEEHKESLKSEGIPEGHPFFEVGMKNLLRRYEFLGRIIGKCLYEGILVDINFAGFFLLKWALTGGEGQASNETAYRANINDLRDLDEGLYRGLIHLKNYTGDVAEDLALNFTVSDTITTNYRTGATKTVTRDLKPGGADIAVDNQNRLLYIQYIVRYRLAVQPQQQTKAFLRGLSSMISPSWLSMFNQIELQTLIGGTSSSIDVDDLRRNTQYGGLYVRGDDPQDHPTIQIFWRVMESLSDKERRAVLKFITSTPRAPLLGFGSLNPRFSIRDSGDDESRLPSASTCVNLMKLPRYKSEGVLREKLLYAVLSGAGFDLS